MTATTRLPPFLYKLYLASARVHEGSIFIGILNKSSKQCVKRPILRLYIPVLTSREVKRNEVFIYPKPTHNWLAKHMKYLLL